MRKEDFLSALDGIDEDLLEPVAESRAAERKSPVRFAILIVAVAAVLITVAAFSVSLGMRGPAAAPIAPTDETESGTEQITETEPYVIADAKTMTDTEKGTETDDDTIGTDTDPVSSEVEIDPTLVPEPNGDNSVSDDPTPVKPIDSEKDNQPDRQPEKTDSRPVETDPPRHTETEPQTEPDDSEVKENPPVDPGSAYLMEDFAKIIFELEGVDISYSSAPGSRPLTEDETVDLWFIQNVVSYGLTQGVGEPPPFEEQLRVFRQTNVTRGVAATILRQYAKYRGIPDLTVREWRGFSDVDEKDPKNIPVIALYRAGFMDPTEEDRFGVDDPSSIEEIGRIAEVIRSYSDNMNDLSGE